MKLCDVYDVECRFKTEDAKCSKKGRCCYFELKPRNLAKPNAQPVLSDGADEGLKACPYCGGSNLTEFNGRIECEGCGAHGPDEQRGICWNDRAFA